ncbi:MAG: ATP-binding protein [archaeon YNP-WB-062]|nr:ATP-binding protein [Candidatus Culexarchaeum yellowstonense]
MLREDIERFNEWWFTGRVRGELAPKYKRHTFKDILESLNDRRITMITGLRRVGKTTILYQLIENILTYEDPRRLLYFSFDETHANLREVLSFYERNVLMKPLEEAGRVYVFLDEVQYAMDWASTLKRFYDLYPKIKFVISGSSTILLSREALEKLAGRFTLMELKPLTFKEFLEMRGIQIGGLEYSQRRMEIYFMEYLRKAGFPEIVDWSSEVKISEYIRNAVVDRVVIKDVPRIFKTRDMILMEEIVENILSNPGGILNVNSMARDLGRSKITISNYLKFLEASLIVKSLSNYRPSKMASSRKLKKFYPSTTSLIYAYSKETFEENMGRVLETYIVNTLNAEYYYRMGGREINVILKSDGRIIPVEVKENVDARDIEKFKGYMRYINAESGVMITLNQEMDYGGVKIYPAYKLEDLKLKQLLA